MPIDRKRRLLFIHIPKTAGTSVEECLGLRSNWQDENRDTCFGLIQSPDLLALSCSTRFLQHLTYSELQLIVGSSIHELFAFAVVRDPWTRLLSSFQRKDPDLCAIYRQNYGLDLNIKGLHEYIDLAQSFDHPHLRSQTAFLRKAGSGPRPSSDIKLFRQEQLHDLQAWLCQFTGETLCLPHSNVNLPKQELPDLSDAEWQSLESKVRQIYHDDCQNFGYPMP